MQIQPPSSSSTQSIDGAQSSAPQAPGGPSNPGSPAVQEIHQKLQKIIQPLLQSTELELVACRQIKALLHIPTLSQTVQMILEDKEKKSGIENTEGSFHYALNMLQEYHVEDEVKEAMHERSSDEDTCHALTLLVARSVFQKLCGQSPAKEQPLVEVAQRQATVTPPVAPIKVETPTTIVDDHKAIEADIRSIQALNDPFTISISEKRVVEIVQHVTQAIFPDMVKCIRASLTGPDVSVASVTRDYILHSKGQGASDQIYLRPMHLLQKTLFGKELLLRTAHTFSSLKLPLRPGTTVKELHRAATMLAASPLLEEPEVQEALKVHEANIAQTALSKEEALVESAHMEAAIAESKLQNASAVTTTPAK